MQLTLKIGTFPVGVADLILIYQEVCVQLGVLNGHGSQRQIVRSVVWRCEDPGRVIVTVTNVTNDLVEDYDRISVEDLTTAQMDSECYI